MTMNDFDAYRIFDEDGERTLDVIQRRAPVSPGTRPAKRWASATPPARNTVPSPAAATRDTGDDS